MDQFRIVNKIGHGSYGQVWLVKHKKDKKHYVLKQINLENASQREIRAAHLEVQLLASLRHPNIVCYRDAFKSGDSLLFIAMSYCEGGDLYKKIKEQKGIYFQEIQVVEWFIQICMALQYLHERNILHRDLKTQNIFLTRSKVIKVGDLGIAKVLDSESAMATTLIGTPYYMSPELFSNKPYNHKSDVWALGCCIYEIATLRHAFNANDINALMYKILRGKLPCMPRQYSSELVSLIRAMLNQNPEQRPAVSRILRDAFVKKNIAVFLEGTKVSMRRNMGPPERKKPEFGWVSDSENRQDVVIRRVVERVPELNAPSRWLPEKNRARINLCLEGQSIFQPVLELGANNSDKNELLSPKDVPIECKDYKVTRTPRVSSSRSTSSEECSGDAPFTDEIISSDLVITGSEIKLEERNVEILNEQKKSPRRQKEGRLGVQILEKRETPQHQKPLLHHSDVLLNVNNVMASDVKDPNERCLPEVHSVCSIAQKQSCTVHANEPIQQKNLSKVSHTRQRFNQKRVNNVHTSLNDSPSCPKDSDVERNDASENPDKQEGDSNETNRRNLSARQRRRAKIKQELHSSGENEAANEDCQSQVTDPNLHKSPLGVEKNELVGRGNEKQMERHQKGDDDLTMLLTLLNVTLHDERSSPAEDEPQECPRQHNSGLVDADTRLKSRIKLLHRDCVDGLGLSVLSEALQMLNNYSSLELETKLQNLLGMPKFVQFIGKIWQLKFCQDSVENCQGDK